MSRAPSLLTLLGTVILGLSLVGLRVDGAAAELAVGGAKVDITPPVGTPLAGYGRYNGRPSHGVHDPLYARVLALTHAGHTVVVVSCDLVLIDAHLRHAVLTRIRQTQPLPTDALILVATHTHTGAGALGSRFWKRP
jgi:neutral ceramidase